MLHSLHVKSNAVESRSCSPMILFHAGVAQLVERQLPKL